MTTHVEENNLKKSLFGTIHETGHRLCEQGIRVDLEGTPLGDWASYGVHESQSRIWDNLVGRSRGFWVHLSPRLQEVFPGQLGSVSLEAFHRAINKVQPSHIHIQANEVTYDLHMMLRVEIEYSLLGGPTQGLARTVPGGLWHRAPDDRDGAL
jgi:carboxypeptidase Taq